MSEMVELVAKAIAPKAWTACGKLGVDNPAQDARRKASLKHARAAIVAMREPTFDPETVSYHAGMTRADWWSTMIDEALK